eukprot:scaffold108040_cov122-Cyclotella_meneghiniana.AAC.6
MDSTNQPATTNEESWKVFQRDTEAGRLLSRLYGCPASKSKISYPKRRRRATNDNQENVPNEDASRSWKTTYTVKSLSAKEEAERDSQRKQNKSRAASMKIPKVGRQSQTVSEIDMSCTVGNGIAKVDLIPRRKTESGCKSNVEEVKFMQKKFRPPASHSYSSDFEKQRLNDLFSNGSGKCLPKDLTTLPVISNSAVPRNTKSSSPDSLFDQINQEITERREHQLEMERLGAGEGTRQQTVNEIQSRCNQLRKVDPSRAVAVIEVLMK